MLSRHGAIVGKPFAYSPPSASPWYVVRAVVVAAHHRCRGEGRDRDPASGWQCRRCGHRNWDSAARRGRALDERDRRDRRDCLVREAPQRRITVIDFGARSPHKLDPGGFRDHRRRRFRSVRSGRSSRENPECHRRRRQLAVPAMVAGHCAWRMNASARSPGADLPVMPAAEIAQNGVSRSDWYFLPDRDQRPGGPPA